MIELEAEASFEKWIASIPMHQQMTPNIQSALRSYFIGGFTIGFRSATNLKENVTNERTESGTTAV